MEQTFLPDLNGRFTVAAASAEDWHRPLSAEQDLSRIVSVQEERVVQNDWTIRWRNEQMQLSANSAAALQPTQRVTLCEQLDGQLRVFAGALEVSWTAACRWARARVRSRADHPWRGRPRDRLAATETVPDTASGEGG